MALFCAVLLFCSIFPASAYATGAVIIIPDEEEEESSDNTVIIVPDEGDESTEDGSSGDAVIIIPDDGVDDGSGGAATIIPDNGEPADVTISSTTTTSYFETNTFTGTWRDTGTPLHLINETGYIAYCLQTAMVSPNNSGYTKIYWWDIYDSKTADGVFAIITNGYPNNTGGFTEEQARYATANALRFWLGECGAEGAYDWMNLKTYPDNFRGKSGYEDLFDWCVELVEIARAETDGIPDIELNPYAITLVKSGDYYVGSTTVNVDNCSGGYEVDMYTVPYGVEIEGSTGGDGSKITVKVPASMAGESFTFCVDGVNEYYDANLVYYAPSNSDEQHVVAYTPDPDAMSVYTSLTVTVPDAEVDTEVSEDVPTANISIAKMDGDTREYLEGAVIALYDADKNLLQKKTTNANGSVYFADIPLGDYYLQEVKAPDGYVLNDRMMDICLDEEMTTFMRWLYNYKPEGSLTITKTDSSNGAVLQGAEFTIYDSGKNELSSGTTDSSGKLTFTELAPGSYYYRETAAPSGYVLDSNYYSFTITEDDLEVSVNCKNTIPLGAVHITKKDRATGEVLSGVEFTLYDSNKSKLKSGTTGNDGTLMFKELTLGTYYVKETAPLAGYIANDTYNSFSITANNQTVYKNIYNDRILGSLSITKINASGTALPGAAFLLESSANGSTWTSIAEKTSDETGTVKFEDLDISLKYRLTETKAPPGHSLQAGTIFEGSLADETDLSFTVCDCAIPMLPFTGSRINFIPAFVLMLSMGIFITQIKTKRRKA